MRTAYLASIVSLLCMASVHARDTCFDTDVKSDEVVVEILSYHSSCALVKGYRLTVSPIDLVLPNNQGERLACAGWSIPTGYTAKPSIYTGVCAAGRDGGYGGSNTQPLMLNQNPIGGGKTVNTSVNAIYYGSAAMVDPDNDVLTYSYGGVGSGASFDLDSQTGSYTFTPALSFEGSVNVTVTAEDGKGGYAYYLLTFNVGNQSSENRPPVVTEYTTEITTGLTMAVQLRGSDPDGDIPTLKLDTSKPPLHGIIQRVTDAQDPNLYKYTPNANYLGLDYVNVIASDGELSDTGVIMIKVVTADRDGDGIPNWNESDLGLNPDDPTDAAKDSDGDGLSNLVEYQIGTKLFFADSDGDSMPDGYEHNHSPLNPLSETDASSDADSDGHSNLAEYQAGTDPLNAQFYPGNNPIAWLIPIMSLLLN